MSEHPQDSGSFREPNEAEVVVILKKMQQQLVYLEKKIDTLLAQRPAQDRQHSRTYNSHRPYSAPRTDYGNRPMEGRPHGTSHFNKQHSDGNSSFGYCQWG